MRDPERIDDVVNDVRILWNLYPDLRLGQIIDTISRMSNNMTFYIEDDILHEYIKNIIVHGWDTRV